MNEHYLEKIYKEIIDFNLKYLEVFYSNAMVGQRRREKAKSLSFFKCIKEMCNSLHMRTFWKKVDSVENNINFYDDNNSCVPYEKGDKVAVYTCIVGNYDNLIEPFFVEQGVDYFIFTDLDVPADSVWKKIDITKFEEYNCMSPTELNRKIKILAHKYLSGYKFTIYVDGVVKIMVPVTPWLKELNSFGMAVHYHNTRDCIYKEAMVVAKLKRANEEMLKQQLEEYLKIGYPKNNGMFENTLLIRNASDEATNELMESWWEEYKKYPTRDQISLPYVVWRENYDRKKIFILGNNLNMNPRIIRELRHN